MRRMDEMPYAPIYCAFIDRYLYLGTIVLVDERCTDDFSSQQHPFGSSPGPGGP